MVHTNDVSVHASVLKSRFVKGFAQQGEKTQVFFY